MPKMVRKLQLLELLRVDPEERERLIAELIELEREHTKRDKERKR